MTHRGKASAFVVVSGHAPEAWTPVIDGLAPGAATIVVLMGLGSRGAIAGALVARGWRSDTPVAVLLSASQPEADTWVGTLGALAAGAPALDGTRAGTIVIGNVVQVGRQLGLLRRVGRGVGRTGRTRRSSRAHVGRAAERGSAERQPRISKAPGSTSPAR